MPRKPPDPIKAAARKSRARRRVGEDAACGCGETRPLALEAGSKPISCAACSRRKRGKKATDTHHVAGENNSPVTIEMPVNDHRAILNAAQYDWPNETLKNPRGSPMLAAAASLRGISDAIQYLIEAFIEVIAVMLEALDGWLTAERGEQWWVGTPVARYAP